MKIDGMPNPGGVYMHEYKRDFIFYFVLYSDNSNIGYLRTIYYAPKKN